MTRAHGLDSGQYTFNYVAGWASRAATPEHGIEAVVAETGAWVIAAADKILAHTKPADLEVKSIDAVAEGLGLAVDAGPEVATPSADHEVWETITSTPSLGAREEARRPPSLELAIGSVAISQRPGAAPHLIHDRGDHWLAELAFAEWGRPVAASLFSSIRCSGG